VRYNSKTVKQYIQEKDKELMEKEKIINSKDQLISEIQMQSILYLLISFLIVKAQQNDLEQGN